MISLKSPRDIDGMEVSGRLVAECLAIARDMVKPGISTAEINEAVERNILDHGAKAAFKGFPGPKGLKISLLPVACRWMRRLCMGFQTTNLFMMVRS